jgi:NADPH:quinone reductase-like Zn-dependent oxidoreductase
MNFSDLYTRKGLLRDLQPPLVLGTECAGEVMAVGAAVTHIKVSRTFTVLFVVIVQVFLVILAEEIASSSPKYI